ncbi:MAG: hypothetical protein HC881_01030 [Leptolyngbyaceae cyanobacterium SL_7_1]|nr:hypothetical protein [Leptolyngbyaceae cyanobacterium SL_7_1]
MEVLFHGCASAQPSSFPTIPPPAEAARRWWNAIYCQTEELWQTITSRDTGKIYKEATWKTGQILILLLRLLLLIGISILGVFVFVWLLGYHSGHWLREHLEADQPTPAIILNRLIAILLLPFQLTAIWLDRELNQAFGWNLKLTDLLPPPDPNLLPPSDGADDT